eukprot:7504769-Pyramimonas_sp.AAC.1
MAARRRYLSTLSLKQVRGGMVDPCGPECQSWSARRQCPAGAPPPMPAGNRRRRRRRGRRRRR